MIKRYRFGETFDTGAVTGAFEEEQIIADAEGNVRNVDLFCVNTDGTVRFRMEESDIVYGLGEQSRGLNKRGWHYESLNTDNPHQDEGRTSLYGAHNFLVVDGKNVFGLFLDTPSYVSFDLGYTRYDEAEIKVNGAFDLYLILEPTPKAIVSAFRRLIGRPYVPPRWAFGFGQSRWGYKTADDVRKIVKTYHDLNFPIDAVYMDIDYMDDYMNFTVDPEKFPKFSSFTEEMKEQGIRLVPIIDAGIKVKNDYRVYEEGHENGYFVKDENGNDFVVGVWPGESVFPDVLQEDAAKWFGSWYRALTDQGIEGFWNDMNEPSIFYAKDRVTEAFRQVLSYKDRPLGVTTFFEVRDLLGRLSNDPKDYERFYHKTKTGMARHDTVHNLYGYLLTKAAAEGLRAISPDRRMLLFSRSSYIGMHRYAGIWFGDNSSHFSHITANLKLAMNANMVGFLYSGSDIAGFGGDTTPDLAMRWLELGIFLPLFRNHSSRGTREQEFFRFGMEEDFRNLLKLRYALIPFLYSEFMKAVLRDTAYIQPLAFVFEHDERAKRIEDQAMIGESCMIAPVTEQNACGRYVYLPEDMVCYRMRSPEDMDRFEVKKGDRYIEAALNETLLFVRKGFAAFLTDAAGVRSTEDLETRAYRILKADSSPVTYELYEDDGFTREISEKKIRNVTL